MRDVLKTIERRALALEGEELCQHYPPLIFYPDGTEEVEDPQHNCGRPRLRIHITYANGRPCRRTLLDAVATVRESAFSNPDLQLTDLIAWASEDFGIDADQLTAAFAQNA